MNTQGKVKHNNFGLIKRFLPYYKKYIWIVIIDLLCASLTTICELVLPLIVRYITDTAMSNIAALTLRTVLYVGVFYLMLRIIDALANYYMEFTGHIMGARIETDMRRDMFSHLQELSYNFYDNTKIGQIMSRITTDLFDVTEFAHHCPEEFFIAFLKITAAFIILCRVNIILTLIIFSIIPIMLAFAMIFRKKMRWAFKRQRQQIGELNSQVEDSLLGVRVVKSFANEKIEKQKFEKGNGAFLDIKKQAYKYMARFHTTTRIFDGIMYITVVVAGAIFLIYKKITVPDLTAYLLYVTTLLASIRRIVDFTEQFQRGMTGIERFNEIADTVPDIKDMPNAEQLEKVEGEIEFNNVSFKYSDENESVLRNLNLHIKKGENIALVGPSGAGKTTLCSLIPRFYDVSGGEILLDGRNIRNVTLKSLRDHIGVVQQEVYLFSGSVYENIEYGRPGASKSEIIKAAKLAGADEFISQLEDGYDTYVGERGLKLSGGQKQRISIARVFLKNPPVLILDEATSALDNESENVVQKSLARLASGRTTITIAHRLTTIRKADRILVLTENGIEESGSHKELLEKKGIYYRLYTLSDTLNEI